MDQIIQWHNLEREGGSVCSERVVLFLRDSGSPSPKYSTPQRDSNKIIYFIHSKSTKCSPDQALLKNSYIDLWYILMSKVNNKLSGIDKPGLIVWIENTKVDLIYETDRMVTHRKYGGNEYSFHIIKDDIYIYVLELKILDLSSSKKNESVRIDDNLTLVTLIVNP